MSEHGRGAEVSHSPVDPLKLGAPSLTGKAARSRQKLEGDCRDGVEVQYETPLAFSPPPQEAVGTAWGLALSGGIWQRSEI